MTKAELLGETPRTPSARRRLGRAAPFALITAAVVVPLSVSIVPNFAAVTRPAAILALAAVYVVGLRGAERLRLASSAEGSRQDMLAIWEVFAALVLAPLHLGLVVVALFVLLLPSCRGALGRRAVIAVSTTVLAAEAAGWVHAITPGPVVSVVAGTLTFVTVQPVLVAAVMLVTGQGHLIRGWFGSAVAWTISISTAAIGAAFALCLLERAWLGFVPLMVVTWLVHSWAQHLQLVHDHSLDPLTGLPTEAVWRRVVAQLGTGAETWTVATLSTADPAELARAAQVLGMVCGQTDVLGRLDDRIAVALRAPQLVAVNLLDRVTSDLSAVNVDSAVVYGRGRSIADQVASLDHTDAPSPTYAA